MEITKAYIQQQLEGLKAQADQALTSLRMAEGAIQVMEFLLRHLDEDEFVGGGLPDPEKNPPELPTVEEAVRKLGLEPVETKLDN